LVIFLYCKLLLPGNITKPGNEAAVKSAAMPGIAGRVFAKLFDALDAARTARTDDCTLSSTFLPIDLQVGNNRRRTRVFFAVIAVSGYSEGKFVLKFRACADPCWHRFGFIAAPLAVALIFTGAAAAAQAETDRATDFGAS